MTLVTKTTNTAKITTSYVSVKNYGAVGDGVADDTAAFQLAANSGRAIFIPNGTYLMDTPYDSEHPTAERSIAITGTSGATFIGESKRAILKYGPNKQHTGSGTQPIFYFRDCSKITIKNLTFQGIEADRAEGWKNNERAIVVDCPTSGDYTDIGISDCVFLDWSTQPILLTSFDRAAPSNPDKIRLKDIIISGCNFRNSVGGIITYGGGVQRMLVYGCNFSGGFDNAIKVDGQYTATNGDICGQINILGCNFSDWADVVSPAGLAYAVIGIEESVQDITIGCCNFTRCSGSTFVAVIRIRDGQTGKSVKRVLIDNCVFDTYDNTAISGNAAAVNSISEHNGGSIDGVTVQNCTFASGAVPCLSGATITTFSISTASWLSNVATFTTTTPHGLVATDNVIIDSVLPAGYNGTYVVVSTPTTSSITVALTGDPGAYSAGGTLSKYYPDGAVPYVKNIYFLNNIVDNCNSAVSAQNINGLFINNNSIKGSTGISINTRQCYDIYIRGNSISSPYRGPVRLTSCLAGNIYIHGNSINYTGGSASTYYTLDVDCSAACIIKASTNYIITTAAGGGTSIPVVRFNNFGTGTSIFNHNYVSNFYEGVNFSAGASAVCVGNVFENISYAALVCQIATKGYGNCYVGSTVPSYNSGGGIYGYASYTLLTAH